MNHNPRTRNAIRASKKRLPLLTLNAKRQLILKIDPIGASAVSEDLINDGTGDVVFDVVDGVEAEVVGGLGDFVPDDPEAVGELEERGEALGDEGFGDVEDGADCVGGDNDVVVGDVGEVISSFMGSLMRGSDG